MSAGFLIGVSLAVLPLPIVIGALRWVDRYEPEPRALLAFAFFWGATVAALIAATLNTASAIIVARTSDAGQGMATTGVLIAPWVEEGAKGAAVLAVFLFRRKEFDGIVDGIVLAGFVGVGFAFTENILYFGRAFLAGNEQLGVTGGLFAAGSTFVLRGVLAPFAHPLFTTMTGHRVGHRGAGTAEGEGAGSPRSADICWPSRCTPPGTTRPCRGCTDSWSATCSSWCRCSWSRSAVATWSRRREGATIATWLPLYVQSGWLVDDDVAMLASMPRRRQATAWAERTYGGASSRALHDFQLAGTELAFLRDRAERGHPVDDFTARERQLLAELSRSRAAVSSPART